MEKIENANVEEVKEESKFIAKIKASKKYLKYAGVAAVSVVTGALLGRASLKGNDGSGDCSEDTNVEYSIDDSSDEN